MATRLDTGQEGAEADSISDLAELVYNGKLIDWRDWVHTRAKITAAQFARLASGLDPLVFENINNRPNKNDPSRQCQHARSIQGLAKAENKRSGTHLEWLAWADAMGLEVQGRYRLEVEGLANGLGGAASHEQSTEAPLQRHRFQEAEILRVISDLGHCATKLPKNKPGRPGVKADVRRKFPRWTDFVFKKAWERLRGSGDIADAE